MFFKSEDRNQKRSRNCRIGYIHSVPLRGNPKQSTRIGTLRLGLSKPSMGFVISAQRINVNVMTVVGLKTED